MSDANALHDALAAEREGRLLEAFELGHVVLAQTPADPDALNLVGRICYFGGDLTSAIGLQQLALRAAPGHTRAASDLRIALAAIPAADEGHAALREALEQAPDLTNHLAPPGLLEPLDDAVRVLLERAINLNPALGEAYAAFGNLLARTRVYDGAMVAYRRALLLEPDDAAMHLALAEIAFEQRDAASEAHHRAEAFARRRTFSPPVMPKNAMNVLVLAMPGPWSANVSLDFMLAPERTILHRYYLTKDPPVPAPQLPPYDLVFNAIGESEAAQPFIAAAATFIAAQARPTLNLPEHLAKTARPALHSALAGVTEVRVARAVRLSHSELDIAACAQSAGALQFPLLIRPLDEHGGRGLERLNDASEIAGYLTRYRRERYDLCEFIDYRDPDGFYRKYRVIFVDGVAYAYHLAISTHWMVHYLTSPMAEHPWMREEEAAFLAAPPRVFPQWERSFPAIAAAIELDYFGIDCARTPDGEVLIFEADAATWIHNADRAGVFAYKAPFVERIFSAVEAMFASRVRL